VPGNVISWCYCIKECESQISDLFFLLRLSHAFVPALIHNSTNCQCYAVFAIIGLNTHIETHTHTHAHTIHIILFSANRFMPRFIGIGRSQWPHGLRFRSVAESLLGSSVRNPPGAWMFVSCTVFVFLVSGLYAGPIPGPEESYRLWCVSECDQVKIKNLSIYCQ
jgi:hypothetical protein